LIRLDWRISSRCSKAPTRADVAQMIATSTEYRSNLIESYFQRFLRRPASSSEINYWVGLLASGSTDEQVIAHLLASNEYYVNQAGGTNNGFIAGVYRDLLGRNPDSAEISYWTTYFGGGGSRYNMALAVDTGPEYYTLLV
jgi:hypothetical protein